MWEKIRRFSYFAIENQELWVEHIALGKTDLTLNMAGQSEDIMIDDVFEKNTTERKNFKRI